jgi:hypothetical protein
LHGVLAAEAKSGRLALRSHDSAALARTAREPKTFEVLSRAVSEGSLDPAWARAYVRAAAPEELVEAARRWLQDPAFWQRWGNVPKLLLDGLRSLEPAPDGLGPLLIATGIKLDPVANLEIYLRLADLVARIDQGAGRDEENALVAGLWKALPRLTDPRSREYLVGLAFDPDWRCLRAIRTSVLLELASSLQKEESYVRFYEDLDRRLRRDPEATTEALVRTGWWYFWRRRSRLKAETAEDAEVLRRSARAWLASEVWTGGMGIEATLEAWKQALADLPPQLSGPQMAHLRGGTGRRRWPWIPPFEEEQLDALIERAEDLGALAELAEAIRSDESVPWSGQATHEYVLPRSRFAKELPPAALGWLFEDRYRSQLPVLNLDHSAALCRLAGHRADRALEARIRSVAQRLDQVPWNALQEADAPYLWSNGRFLTVVGDWMNRNGSLTQIGVDVARWIDDHIDGEPESPVRSPSQKLVAELVAKRLNRAAWLLQPEFQKIAQQEALADEEIQALLAGSDQAPCWQQLAEKVTQMQAVDGIHPLALLAERIRTQGLSREQRRRLASNGWLTFERAAHANPALMKLPPNQVPGLPHLDLAASLLGPGALGSAILQIVFTAANRGWREDAKWWRRLLCAMRDFRWHRNVMSVDDRQEVALALVIEYLDALSSPERQALFGALRQEAKDHPEWTLPSEFGVRRQ